MKKHKKAIIRAASVFLIGAVTVVCLFYYPIFPRIYFGNRIKGDVTITCDGKPYALNPDRLKSAAKVRETGNGRYYIELKGGEYGSNPFEIELTHHRIVEVNIFHSNWWYVTDFNLDINIDSSKKEITYKGWYTSSEDSAAIERKQTIGKEKLEVKLGTV